MGSISSVSNGSLIAVDYHRLGTGKTQWFSNIAPKGTFAWAFQAMLGRKVSAWSAVSDWSSLRWWEGLV